MHLTRKFDEYTISFFLRFSSRSNKERKRVGRGPGSGMGKTSTRGHKGQKSRSGSGPHRAFEGGQTPLTKRFPKRGFTNANFRMRLNTLNLKDLQLYFDMGRLQQPEDGSPITMKTLVRSGIISRRVWSPPMMRGWVSASYCVARCLDLSTGCAKVLSY